MFGIIHGLFTFLALGVDGHNKKVETLNNKHRAIQNNQLTYNGARGNEYLVSNDKWVSTKINRQGETIIADMKSGEVYYNITQNKKDQKNQECLKQGKTVRFKMLNEQNQTYYGKYNQTYSRVDIETGIPVSEVYINGITFYIELKNAMILRPSDNVNMKNYIPSCTIDEIIKIMNERQNKIKHQINILDQRKINQELFYKNSKIYIDKNKNINIVWHLDNKKIQELYGKDGFKYNREKNQWI